MRRWLLVLLSIALVGCGDNSATHGRIEASFRPSNVELTQGADVRLAGENVGRVTELSRTGGELHIVMLVEPQVDVSARYRLVIRAKTLVPRENYVELVLDP